MPRYGQYEIYDETVHGPHQKRNIKAGDHRDPDNVLDIAGARVVELEQTTPNRRVVVQGEGGEHIDLQAWLEQQVGRVIVLPIIARDEQQHN